MKQTTEKILGTQTNILAIAGSLFQNTNIKVAKKTATLTNDILKAGTIVDKTGKKVTDGTAFGIVYEDVDFKNSTGTEIVPVTIFGFVKENALVEKATPEAKAALKMIQFL